MGCVGGKRRKESLPVQPPRKFTEIFNRKQSEPLMHDELTTQDWQVTQDVLKKLRTQGTDFDITVRAFERMFDKHPKTMQVFMDAGIIKPGDFQKPLRAQVRLILDALNKLVDLKNDDEKDFRRYRKELLRVHDRTVGFNPDYYERFGECLFHSLQTTMGSTLTKTQYDSFRIFCGNLENLMTSLEDQDTISSVDKRSNSPSEWHSTEMQFDGD